MWAPHIFQYNYIYRFLYSYIVDLIYCIGDFARNYIYRYIVLLLYSYIVILEYRFSLFPCGCFSFYYICRCS